MEYKRAALMLPLILRRLVILITIFIMVVGMIAFCVEKYIGSEDEPLVRIGYVAEEDMLTAFAVSYVEQMESVKSFCSLEKTTAEEGKLLLEKGELAALLVLPENVIDEILTGRNAPAVLYLPNGTETDVTASKIFEELANAGIGMLQTAQAEIYVTAGLREQLSEYASADIVEQQIQAMYDDINRFNLGVVTNREYLFKQKKLSITGNNTYMVYYAAAFLTIYMLVSGLFIGQFCKRRNLQQCMIAKRLGVSYFGQLISRVCAAVPLLMMIGILPFLALLYPPVYSQLSIVFSAEYMVAVIVLLIFIAIYLQLIYQLVEEPQRAILVLGLLTLFQGYMAGCIIPEVLLPQGVSFIGGFLPAAYIKKIFTMLFTGSTRELHTAVRGLVVWSVICFVLAWSVMHFTGYDRDAGKKRKMTYVSLKNPVTNSLPYIILKRLIHQKSLWVCLFLVVVLSAVIVRLENSTETVISAAVYDEDGTFSEELSAYTGLVSFVLCDSEEEVKQLVLRDKTECGYVIPKNLTESMIEGKANRSITVYEDGDAVVSRVVDEVLFNEVFKLVSVQWYQSYMTQKQSAAAVNYDEVKQAVESQIAGNTTFRFQIERLGAASNHAAAQFPVHLVGIAGSILCGIQGAVQAAADYKQNRFYKRNRAAVVLLTIILPMILGLIAGILAINCLSWEKIENLLT